MIAELLTILAFSLMWSIFFGSLTGFNLTIGALLGLLLLSVLRREEEHSFPRRLWAFLTFVVRFFVELILANFVIANLAIRPRPKFHPHIIAVPLKLKSNSAISLLSATITLLPGTVAMGVSKDKSLLYAHAIGEEDVDKARDSVVRIEKLILGFME